MEQQPSQEKPIVVNETRRRLTKGSLAAPVVLATLSSKNALAAVPYNCTVSGKLSGNTSSHGSPVSCSSLGVSPGCWKSPHVVGAAPNYIDTRWPAPYKPSSLFTTAFTSYPTGYDTMSLLQALEASGGGSVAFTRSAVATLLNALKFLDYPLTAPQVKSIYNSIITSGSVVLSNIFTGVTGTATWTMDDAKAYFESLYGGEIDSCPGGKP